MLPFDSSEVYHSYGTCAGSDQRGEQAYILSWQAVFRSMRNLPLTGAIGVHHPDFHLPGAVTLVSAHHTDYHSGSDYHASQAQASGTDRTMGQSTCLDSRSRKSTYERICSTWHGRVIVDLEFCSNKVSE